MTPYFYSPFVVPGRKIQSFKKILEHIPAIPYERWLEPFAGSCIVGINANPEEALFADNNPYIMQFFIQLKKGIITPEKIQTYGEKFIQKIRRYKYLCRHFSEHANCLDYFFISLFALGGFVTFTQAGNLVASPGRIPKRLLLKNTLYDLIRRMRSTWEFKMCSYTQVFERATTKDLLYADPPLVQTRIQGYRKWTEKDSLCFRKACFELPCPCMVSLWLERKGIRNPDIELWQKEGFVLTEIPVCGLQRSPAKDALLVRQ